MNKKELIRQRKGRREEGEVGEKNFWRIKKIKKRREQETQNEERKGEEAGTGGEEDYTPVTRGFFISHILLYS